MFNWTVFGVFFLSIFAMDLLIKMKKNHYYFHITLIYDKTNLQHYFVLSWTFLHLQIQHMQS